MDVDIRPVKRSVWDEVDDADNGDFDEPSHGSFTLPFDALSMTQRANLRQAKKFCEALTGQWRDNTGVTQQQLLMQQQQQLQLQQLMQVQEASQRQKAFSVMCRIYVGSISFEMHEGQVKEAFSSFGPIKSLGMSWDSVTMKHKGFCFIEYFVPEAAQLALDQMNGVLLGGRNVKVGRPSSVPAAAPYIMKLNQEAQAYHRIYVSGLNPAVPEQAVHSAFENCGTIRAFQLAPDGRKGHRGFGYVEYQTAQACATALAKMNLMQLAGCYMRVCKAVTPPFALQVPTTSCEQSVTQTAQPGMAGGMPPVAGNFLSKLQAANAIAVNHAQEQSIHHEEAIHISGGSARLMLMQKLQRKDESNVVVLRNMVTPAEVDSDLPGEVKDECGRFGVAQQVIIHEQLEGGIQVIKIFVQFMLAHEAQRAIKGLHGRFFGGKTVRAEIYDRDKFERDNLSA